MSLIEEALRRMKEPLIPPAATKAKPPQEASPSQAPMAAHSWSQTPAPSPSQPATATRLTPMTIVTLAVLVLTAALMIGGATWMWRTFNGRMEAAPEPSMVASPGTASRPESTAPARTTRASSDALSEFKLTGIVEGLGDPYAMINGSIVAVGETIGNATLLDIDKGMVTLRLADGTETVLRVAR